MIAYGNSFEIGAKKKKFFFFFNLSFASEPYDVEYDWIGMRINSFASSVVHKNLVGVNLAL